MLDNNLASNAEIKEIDKKVKKEIDDAVEKAKNDPFPKVEEDLYTDVYIDNSNHYMRGVEYN